MLRGLLALGLATCVVGAPLATDLCQAACAMRSADAMAAHHSCHAEAPPAGVCVFAVHMCGHTDELPGADRPEHGMTAVAVMPAAGILAPAIDVARPCIASIQPSPPLLAARTSELRV